MRAASVDGAAWRFFVCRWVHKPRILVIEDEPLVQRTLRRIVAPENDVVICDSGAAAIELLETDVFEAVFSDYELQGPLTGGDVLRWIKSNRPTLAENFIFVSGSPMAASLHHRVITKPFLPVTIRNAIRGLTIVGRCTPDQDHSCSTSRR